jgi:hypothetical protein
MPARDGDAAGKAEDEDDRAETRRDDDEARQESRVVPESI